MSSFETNRLITRLRRDLLGKSCKETQITVLCDKTSGDIAGYQVLIHNPSTPEVTIQWYDTDGSSLEAQPANSTIC